MKTADRLDEIIYQADKLKENVIDEELTEPNKYKQALEEIRKIAKGACDSSVCHYDCKQCSDGKIIDKIDEVLK